MSAPISAGRLGWGILATGGVARLFTKDLLGHGHRVAAVGSRAAESAQAFADEFGIPGAHASYAALMQDPDVDVVYVATPHSLHADNVIAALEAGKHVLVEKAFTMNADQARAVAEVARASGLLVMEAMWTRFLPHMRFVRDVVRTGRLGEVRSVHADHSQQLTADPAHRLNHPALAGGALLDLGCYPLSFVHDILGPPTEVVARATKRDTGVDASVATIMSHRSEAVSTTYSTMETRGPNRAVVLGTEGRIDIAPVWYSPAPVTVYDADDNVIDSFDQSISGRGMQYQAAEVERLLAAGKAESPLLTVADSVAVMATMDQVRDAIGVRYPGE